MCRMSFVETTGYRPSAWRMMKFAMRQWGAGNDDGTGIAWQRGESIYVLKDAFEAKRFFKAMDFSPKSSKILGHCRAGTNGSNTKSNAHPFYSCDGKSVFCHNGIVSGYGKYKAALIAKGHKFTSETDSEVILHTIEEVGPENAMKELEKHGVRGSANWIYFTPSKTYAFSDGSLYLVENQKGLRVGLFSDLAPFGKKFFHKPEELKSGTLVTVENGKVIEKKDVGTISASYAVEDYHMGGYGYTRRQGGWRTIHYGGQNVTRFYPSPSVANNVTTDAQWSEMLEQDSPKESAVERELSGQITAAEAKAQQQPNVGLDALFGIGAIKSEDVSPMDFGIRRKPVITLGKAVTDDNGEYARAMQAFLKGKAREEAADRRNAEEQRLTQEFAEAAAEAFEVHDKHEWSEEEKREWSTSKTQREDPRDTFDRELQELETGAMDKDEALQNGKLGGFYCKRCDKVYERANAQDCCPACYGPLFDINENRYLEDWRANAIADK